MASTTNNNYVDPARLSSLVRDFYSTGNYPTELDDAILQIVEGYIAGHRIRYCYGDAVADDVLSDAHIDASMAIVKRLVDPDCNIFNYITRIAGSCASAHCAKHNAFTGNLQLYATEILPNIKEKMNAEED